MPTRLSSRKADILKKALEPESIKRLEKSGYLIKDPNVKERRRAKLPPARKAPTRKEITKTLAAWYQAAGLEKKRWPKAPGSEPDVDDGVKKLPKFKFKALVRNLKVTRGGTFLQFDFKTTVPCIPLVCASRGTLYWSGKKLIGTPQHTSLLGTAFSGYKTTHSVALIDLEPRGLSPYNYVILLKPKEDDSPWEPAEGSAHTLRRHVFVTVDKVQMLDAADFGGTGEMSFKSQIGHPGFDCTTPGNSLDFARHPAGNDPGGAGGGQMYVSSGDMVPLNFKLLGMNIGDSIEHTFSTLERDAGSFWPGSLDTYGSKPQPDKWEGTYDIGSWEAASGKWTYNVDGGTLMSGKNGDSLMNRERYSVSYVRHVAGGNTTDLNYFVYGKIRVIYAF